MKTKDRKVEHKKVIKYIRKWNKTLNEDDTIGCGRFRIDMWSEKWYRFSDGSGGELYVLLKLSDTLTNNSAMFYVDNFNYKCKVGQYLNDFMIRCSSGHKGHYPPLNYIAYDIHEIKEYAKYPKWNGKVEEGILDNYDWIKK